MTNNANKGDSGPKKPPPPPPKPSPLKPMATYKGSSPSKGTPLQKPDRPSGFRKK